MPTVPWLVLRSSNSPNIGTFHALRRLLPRLRHGPPHPAPLLQQAAGANRRFRHRHSNSSHNISRAISKLSQMASMSLPSRSLCRPIPWMRDGRPTILFVGRFEEHRKGLRWLLQALPLVEPYFPDLRLVVAGSGDPDSVAEWLPLRDYTRPEWQIYRSAGSALEVEFTGFVPAADLPRYYQSCDVYCAPSTGGESFGIVLLEAMAAGTPVLASRIAGYSACSPTGARAS